MCQVLQRRKILHRYKKVAKLTFAVWTHETACYFPDIFLSQTSPTLYCMCGWLILPQVQYSLVLRFSTSETTDVCWSFIPIYEKLCGYRFHLFLRFPRWPWHPFFPFFQVRVPLTERAKSKSGENCSENEKWTWNPQPWFSCSLCREKFDWDSPIRIPRIDLLPTSKP